MRIPCLSFHQCTHLLTRPFRIKQYFAEVGCRVGPPTETDQMKLKITKAEGKSHFMAKLRLPLQFPKVRTGPSKRR